MVVQIVRIQYVAVEHYLEDNRQIFCVIVDEEWAEF
jgi:hypothetical protein